MAGRGAPGASGGGGADGRIHFGAVTMADRQKITRGGGASNGQAETAGVRTLPFSESMLRKQREHEALMGSFEKREAKKKVAVPTNDLYVQLRLRELGTPICLFGETQMDRRDRLRRVMARQGVTRGMPVSLGHITGEMTDVEEEKQGGELNEEEFFTEGSKALLAARRAIALFSLPRAKERLEKELAKDNAVRGKAEQMTLGVIDASAFDTDEVFLSVRREVEETASLFSSLSSYSSTFSAIGDSRPISACAFQPSGDAEPSHIITGSWSGVCKSWSVANGSAEELRQFAGHEEKVNDVAFHPKSGMGQAETAVSFASASSDCTVKLWAMADGAAPLATLSGHSLKVSGVAFHPSGDYVASTSFDTSWRLWDVETQKELLLQQGHSRPVTAVAMQGDGSLVCSTSCDATGRVWDLRTGRSVALLHGHVRAVISCDFSPNGYQVATGSDDHSVKIWDLRRAGRLGRNERIAPPANNYNPACAYTILAHTKLVSGVRFEPRAGRFLVTSSLDKLVKVWDARDYAPVRCLTGHQDLVMGMDVASDSSAIISSSYDKTWKMWSLDSV